MLNAIVYFKKVNNYKLDTNIKFFLLNFKDVSYIFIAIIYANTNALVILILKFVNIALKEN